VLLACVQRTAHRMPQVRTVLAILVESRGIVT